MDVRKFGSYAPEGIEPAMVHEHLEEILKNAQLIAPGVQVGLLKVVDAA